MGCLSGRGGDFQPEGLEQRCCAFGGSNEDRFRLEAETAGRRDGMGRGERRLYIIKTKLPKRAGVERTVRSGVLALSLSVGPRNGCGRVACRRWRWSMLEKCAAKTGAALVKASKGCRLAAERQ